MEDLDFKALKDSIKEDILNNEVDESNIEFKFNKLVNLEVSNLKQALLNKFFKITEGTDSNDSFAEKLRNLNLTNEEGYKIKQEFKELIYSGKIHSNNFNIKFTHLIEEAAKNKVSSDDDKFCYKCGFKLSSKFIFCPMCGFKLD